MPHPTRSFSPSSLSALSLPHELRHVGLQRLVAVCHLTFDSRRPTPPDCCQGGPGDSRQLEDVELRAEWREWLSQAFDSPQARQTAGGLVWKGVPPSLRAEVWTALLKDKFPSPDMGAYMRRMWDEVEEVQAMASSASPSPFSSSPSFPSASPLFSAFADIEKDVGRTLPSQWLFRTAEGVQSLRRLLLCFAVHCPLVGYCQGLNFIAGSVLLATGGEEVAAFALLCAIVEGGRLTYYTKSMAGCMVDTAVMADLAAFYEPELTELLAQYGLHLSNFCSAWFICLFCNAPLALPHCMRLWDVLFCHGEEALFRVGLALLRHCHSKVLTVGGAEDVMQLFLQRMGDMESVEPLLAHMRAEWSEEPLLAQSIACLRDFHRFEVTAGQSRLTAATLCRLTEETEFDAAELQRLWELFIQPDPWRTISRGAIDSLVHFRYSFCAAVFHPAQSQRFKGRGLIVQPLSAQPPSHQSALTPSPHSHTPSVSRVFSSTVGASSRPLPSLALSVLPQLPCASAEEGVEASDSSPSSTSAPRPPPSVLLPSPSSAPPPFSPPPLPLLANHSSLFPFPSAASDDSQDSIFGLSPSKGRHSASSSTPSASSPHSLGFPSASPSSLSSTASFFPSPSTTVPLPSPPSSPSRGTKKRGGGWASLVGGRASPQPPAPSAVSVRPLAPLQLPSSFSAHRALRRQQPGGEQSPTPSFSATVPLPFAAPSQCVSPAVVTPLSAPLPLPPPSLGLSFPTGRVSSLSPVGVSGSGGSGGSVLSRLFAMLDGLGRGCVDFDEFCLGVWLLKKSSRATRLRAIFCMADVGGRGSVGREELRHFVRLFDALYEGKRSGDGDVDGFVQAAMEKAEADGRLSADQFAAAAALHPHVAHFFRL